MAEAVLVLARLLLDWQFRAIPDRVPDPMAQLTVRARDGIWLEIAAR